MKIAIPIDGTNIDDNIYSSFGRSKSYALVDSGTYELRVIENTKNLNATQGAGIQSAQNVIKAGADIVITLNLGPKAHKVLCGSGVKIYKGEEVTVKENIDKYLNGDLEPLAEANKEGHWA